MNHRAFVLPAVLVAALLYVALACAALAPRSGSKAVPDRTSTASPTLLPLIALPLVHALLAP